MPRQYLFRRNARRWLLTALLVCAGGNGWGDEPASDAEIAFFESRIRPVLVDRCYQCHSQEAAAKNQLKGGLLLDSRAGWEHGGDSGPAIVPGDAAASLLLESLRYESFEMPPDGRLPEGVIRDFVTWIERGAADPRSGDVTLPARGIDLEAGRQHWAYQPLAIPETASNDGPAIIDRHILSKLDAAGLAPVPEADRVTLARRLAFDLTGLPPTPEQIDAFVRDTDPRAYERYVDRLLASPQFGVRWGRNWLDVVRFAESVTLRGLVQHQAWRYRDYVVDAFNEDLPFDQFLREQVAGDLMEGGSVEEQQRRHIATTFLTLTDANLEEQDKEQLRMDVVDEQLGVIGEAILGQTIGCARCHDHKFDPIPAADYYAMAGILRNTRTLQHSNVSRWLERPLPVTAESARQFEELTASLARVQKDLAALKTESNTKAARVVASAALPGVVVDDSQAVFVGEWTDSISIKPYIDAGYRHSAEPGGVIKSVTFRVTPPADGDYEIRLAYNTGSNRSTVVPVTLRNGTNETRKIINQRKTPPIEGMFVSLGRHQLAAADLVEVIVTNEGANGVVIADAVQFLPLDQPQVASDADEDTAEDTPRQRERKQRQQALEAEQKELQTALADRPLYQGVEEEAQIGDLHIQIRGNVHSAGALAPRGFLQVIDTGTMAALPADQSGRLQLGDWLADRSNPLPARVYVNRVWHWLFGAGLVITPDNLGTTGQSPSHPELLDELAGRFIAQGWSTKTLIREIVLSEAYRRQSTATPELTAADPENRLLARTNRKRIEAESLLDAILSVSGRLDNRIGGPTIPGKLSADYTFEHGSPRRAIYWPQLRNSRPRLLVLFDGANPSLVTGRRNASSVAPQALYLLNDPWVLDHARHTADRLLAIEGVSESLRLHEAFRLTLGRPPTDDEEQATLAFLSSETELTQEQQRERWSQLVQSLFCSLEFRFLP